MESYYESECEACKSKVKPVIEKLKHGDITNATVLKYKCKNCKKEWERTIWHNA